MNALTDKQRAIFAFIRDEITRKKRPPTFREIAAKFGFAGTNAVAVHLRLIERKGYLACDARTSRGIRLGKRALAEAGMPLLDLATLGKAMGGK